MNGAGRAKLHSYLGHAPAKKQRLGNCLARRTSTQVPVLPVLAALPLTYGVRTLTLSLDILS